ncbi:hypothetical protein LNO81_14590 [Klebsiella variicola subsp. variicola]|nr:hypothetical protein [Klebsiella variicola subsp. variicola]
MRLPISKGISSTLSALVGYAIGGTASVKSYYRIDDTHARVPERHPAR